MLPDLNRHLEVSVRFDREGSLHRAVAGLLAAGTCFAVIGGEGEIRTTPRGGKILEEIDFTAASTAIDDVTWVRWRTGNDRLTTWHVRHPAWWADGRTRTLCGRDPVRSDTLEACTDLEGTDVPCQMCTKALNSRRKR